jgi:hypothetical protein
MRHGATYKSSSLQCKIQRVVDKSNLKRASYANLEAKQLCLPQEFPLDAVA